MKKRNFSRTYFLLNFLLIPNSALSEAEGKNHREDDPIAIIQARYKKEYINKKRYRLPFHLSNSNVRFQRLNDLEKEEKLWHWFTEKERTNLFRSAQYYFIRKLIITSAVITGLALFFGSIYIAILRTLFRKVNFLLGNSSRNELTAAIESIIDAVQEWLPRINLLSFFFQNNNPAQAGDSGTANSNGFMGLLVLYHALIYLTQPLVWLEKEIKQLWQLYQFLGDPYYETKFSNAESIFVKSLYLFNAKQKSIMQSVLLSAHKGHVTRIHEVESLMQSFRLLPKGVKPVRYDQKAIDVAFQGYSKELKELAENIIAMLVFYTQAIQQGKQRLWQGLPIKPIWLKGITGTGKSAFIKKVCQVAGVNATYVSLTREFGVEFKGESGRKQLLGSPSVYIRALKLSADDVGRNYENNLLIFEDVDDYFSDTMAVEYLKIFLDPVTENVKDVYMRMPIPKLAFVFVTSHTLPKDPSLRDRVMLFSFNGITTVDKKVIMKRLLYRWSSLLADPVLQGHYNQTLSKEDVNAYLLKKANSFIEQRDQGGSMRGSEEEVLKEIMTLVKKNIQEKSQVEDNSEEPKEAFSAEDK